MKRSCTSHLSRRSRTSSCWSNWCACGSDRAACSELLRRRLPTAQLRWRGPPRERRRDSAYSSRLLLERQQQVRNLGESVVEHKPMYPCSTWVLSKRELSDRRD